MGCGTVTKIVEQHNVQPGVNVLEDVSHNFSGAGTQVKVTLLESGMWVIQHKHEYPHLSVLMSGRVLLTTDDFSRILDAHKAPVSVVIEAGVYHKISALEDSVWLCVHQDGKQ